MKKTRTKSELESLFSQALASGMVHNQKDFAEFVGLNPAILSQLLSGKQAVSETMFNRIQNALVAKGAIVGDHNQTAIATAPNATANAGTSSELIAEMRAQREMYAAHIDRLLTILEKSQK